MVESGDASEVQDRRKRDNRLLALFCATYSLVFIIQIAVFASRKWDGFNAITAIFTTAVGSFLATGLLAWKYHGGKAVIATKTVIKRFAVVSVFMAIFATAPLSYIVATETPADALGLLVGSLAIYLSMILTIFLILIIFTVLGFGIVGIVTIVQRRHTGEVLLKVRGITPHTREPSRIPKEKSGLEYTIYRWLFDIPPSLDTRTLRLDPAHPSKSFPWKVFWSALMWMIFFSLVLAVYVSLNPFLLGISRFETLFGASSSLSLLVPVFILPWFIYMRLNARIEGPVQDFKLYDGIKSRMVGTLVAFGTLIVFIRFALRDIDAFVILGNFAVYIVFFITSTFIFTFVYFNYFEDDLASVVARDYEELTRELG